MEQETTTLTKLFYAEDLEKIVTKSTRKQVAFVETIPRFVTETNEKPYLDINIDDERQTLGKKRIESMEIELLFTEEQYNTLIEIQRAKINGYWAIQLPEEIAIEAGRPLIWYFTGICNIDMSNITMYNNMLKAKLTIYRNLED